MRSVSLSTQPKSMLIIRAGAGLPVWPERDDGTNGAFPNHGSLSYQKHHRPPTFLLPRPR